MMKRFSSLSLLGSVIGLFLTSYACAIPAAKILDVSGEVQLVAKNGEKRVAAVFGTVFVGEKLELAPMARIVLGFRKGGRLNRITAKKEKVLFTISEVSILPKKGVSEIALPANREQLVADSIQELSDISAGGVTILRGPPPSKPQPHMVPIPGTAVLDVSPSFSWPAMEGATSYEVTLFLRKDHIWSTSCEIPHLEYPKEQGLEPGRRYRWEVVAVPPKKKSPAFVNEFSVAHPEDIAGLAELASSKEPALMALAAIGYEQSELVSEAITVYEQLVKRAPREAAFHAALADLYDQAGRDEEANKARKHAVELGFKFEKAVPTSDLGASIQRRQEVTDLAQQAMASLQHDREVDPLVVAEILHWACELPASEVAFQRDAQILAARALWDPLTHAAKERISHSKSDLSDVVKELQQAISDSELLLLGQGVPAAVAMLGRLNVASFQYNWQMFDDSQTTLDALAGGIASPTVWEGTQARYWNLRGLLASEDSQFALAFEHHTKALRLRRNTALPIDEAESLNNLGKLLLELGDYEAAVTGLEQAQAIYEQFSGDALHPQLAIAAAFTSINLSKALEATRDFEEPATLLREVAGEREGASKKEFVDSVCHNNLGLLLYQTGQFQESREQLETSQRLASELFGAEHIRTLESVVNLGWLDLTEGNLAAAEKRFRRALTALSESEPEHHRIAEIKGYLARVEALNRDHSKAVALLQSALDDRQQYLTKTLRSALSERDRLAFVQKLRVHTESIGWPGVLDTYLELAPKLEISADQQYLHVLNWKGILHEPSSHLADSHSSDPQWQQLRAEWSSVRHQLRQHVNGSAALNSDLEKTAEELERRLRRMQQVATESSFTSCEDVAAALPKHSVLFDVIEARQYLPRKQGEVVQDNRVYVGFLVDPSGHVSRLDLGDAADIDTAIESFVGRVSSRRSYSRQARRLDRLLVQPLREKLAGVRLLMISADGWLHRVPWGALPGTEKKFWVEEIAFAAIPSAQSLVRRHGRNSTTAPGWLVVGDVEYGTVEQAGVQPPRWQPLASSASEARHIDQLLRRRFSSSEIGTLLTGAEATKDEIVSLLSSCRFVHFATHGSFVDRQADAFDIQGLSAQLDSFLVFAGANQVGQSFESYLTAEEIGHLDLRGTEVVTLSACETGLGHVQAGQGLIGLVSALDRAGVRAVVSALWKVDDAATAKLMETFYAHLLEHDDLAPAAAVREAQLELLTNSSGRYEHPFYWAPWTVTGRPGKAESL